jgi:hypothetical protein
LLIRIHAKSRRFAPKRKGRNPAKRIPAQFLFLSCELVGADILIRPQAKRNPAFQRDDVGIVSRIDINDAHAHAAARGAGIHLACPEKAKLAFAANISRHNNLQNVRYPYSAVLKGKYCMGDN